MRFKTNAKKSFSPTVTSVLSLAHASVLAASRLALDEAKIDVAGTPDSPASSTTSARKKGSTEKRGSSCNPSWPGCSKEFRG